jgi:hypothetical protein
MNKYNIVPSLYKNKVSDDDNSQISIEIESTRKELIEFDRDVNVDLKNLYEQEKSKSFKIRPVFNINFTYNNSYSGITSSKYKNEGKPFLATHFFNLSLIYLISHSFLYL